MYTSVLLKGIQQKTPWKTLTSWFFKNVILITSADIDCNWTSLILHSERHIPTTSWFFKFLDQHLTLLVSILLCPSALLSLIPKTAGKRWLQIPEPTYTATHITPCHPFGNNTMAVFVKKQKQNVHPFLHSSRAAAETWQGGWRGLKRETFFWKGYLKSHNIGSCVNMSQM